MDGLVLSWISSRLLSLIIIPFIIYKLYPPEIKETPNAKEWADLELEKMGK